MKKLSSIIKETSEKQIKENLKESSTVFVVNYPKISSPDITALRHSLKTVDALLFVIKNTVARRALKDSGLEILVKKIEGPCGLVFIQDDPAGVSRILYNFFKTHEQLKIEGGYLKDRLLEKNDIEAMAKLPTKEILRAQVVMTLNSPIVNIVMTLNALLRNLVVCLDQIRQNKKE